MVAKTSFVTITIPLKVCCRVRIDVAEGSAAPAQPNELPAELHVSIVGVHAQMTTDEATVRDRFDLRTLVDPSSAGAGTTAQLRPTPEDGG